MLCLCTVGCRPLRPLLTPPEESSAITQTEASQTVAYAPQCIRSRSCEAPTHTVAADASPGQSACRMPGTSRRRERTQSNLQLPVEQQILRSPSSPGGHRARRRLARSLTSSSFRQSRKKCVQIRSTSPSGRPAIAFACTVFKRARLPPRCTRARIALQHARTFVYGGHMHLRSLGQQHRAEAPIAISQQQCLPRAAQVRHKVHPAPLQQRPKTSRTPASGTPRPACRSLTAAHGAGRSSQQHNNKQRRQQRCIDQCTQGKRPPSFRSRYPAGTAAWHLCRMQVLAPAAAMPQQRLRPALR